MIDGLVDPMDCELSVVFTFGAERDAAAVELSGLLDWLRAKVREERPGVEVSAAQMNMAEPEAGDA